MRPLFPLLIGLAALGACTNEPSRVSATPPSVSYRVNGNDISQANLSANEYCQRYGSGAQYQGLQPTSSGNVAVYNCGGPAAVSGSSVAPDPYANGTVPPADACASFLHQDRPGGSDYQGPPTTGCPSSP